MVYGLSTSTDGNMVKGISSVPLAAECYGHMVCTYYFPLCSQYTALIRASIPKNLRAFENQRFTGDF